MKIIEIIEGNVIPFKKGVQPKTTPNHDIPQPQVPADPYHYVPQDEIDDLLHRFINLGVGSQVLYSNRLAQIIKTPDEDRFIIKFDDTGEKKIIGRKDAKLSLPPKEHITTIS